MLEDARDIAKQHISEKAQRNPVKAIRAKCIDCCGGENIVNEIKECPIKKCALYPFRLGKNPYRSKNEEGKPKRVMSEEHKEKLREALKRARQKKLEAI